MAFVEIEGLSKRYGSFGITEISLSVERGTTMTLMGPSGSGKTSLLRNIAGFDLPDAGHIYIGGREVTHEPAGRRGVGMVFQELALFPKMTVYDNIAYGLRARRITEAEIKLEVKSLAESLKIGELLGRYPFEISSGERQRAAIARSAIVSPDLLLLDEPFSSVDSQLRIALRSELKSFARKNALTMIFVTHDHHEGLFMADSVSIIFDGAAVRSGTPEDVFIHPKSPRIARFLGYNVMEYHGKKVAVHPRDISIGRDGELSVRILSSGFEGEFTRFVAETERGENITILVDGLTETSAEGTEQRIAIERFEELEDE